MKAKCISKDNLIAPYTIGGYYTVRRNDANDTHPLVVSSDSIYDSALSREDFNRHFVVVMGFYTENMVQRLLRKGTLTPDPSDIECEAVAIILNRAVHENGGFSFYTKEDILRAYRGQGEW